MFGGYGEILFLDKHIEENDTITAYAYYKNNEIARKTIDKMNGGTIKDNKINIELITPIPSCLWIGNIDFQKIDIDELIDKLKNFGEIKTLEIYDENNCLYINYMEVDNAVKLKKEIPYILNNAVIEFCIPVANDYKRELYGKNRLINENNNTTINNSLSLDNIENDNENDKYNKSAKRVKIDETQVKENNDSNEVKNESSKSRKIRNKRNRYQGSQAFWSTSVSVKNDSQVKIEDIKLDTEKKVDTSNNEEDKKKDISLKKENNIDKKPVILDEPKPINKMKLALRSWKIKIKTVVSYKGNKINMIVHYIDGDKDKFNEVFGNNNSIKFEKPIEPNENLLKKIKERIGIYRDPSWSVCIGYVDDEGDYTEKMKSDFERIEKVNNKLSRKHHINMMEIPNKKKTIVVLLPSDSYFDYMFEDIFVKESREEKVIMDGFGKFQFFAFIVFDSKVE
ncbi:hypothetical protein H8356DRAFT_1271528 [Neocallimastix lanati (nom. inval.)]|uniref:RRM domain-containing protein n=1 Tax=Neocallimastix californiae TaxID=1754190 RepID=A0A1Y2AGP3_9FUNG|nr:hypothetical protein H8356DRAFT_1271528 [Neocallimastix sp. JGI-2020a]ORY21624.1 hypothetical protein LY90DRAFT_676199 [Neocallimastix californiae]|eukprot:ORY21624.1 hypothetical protein LY90DRAFT_676199 [Neocallimastix californiae]